MNGTKRSARPISGNMPWDFTAIESFVWEDAVVQVDDRGYEETRSFGPIDDHLHCVWFTIRQEKQRIIGLRKANAREVKIWLEN
jgi:uncharacterized DUF497 family protein